jgi:hypothetical protein
MSRAKKKEKRKKKKLKVSKNGHIPGMAQLACGLGLFSTSTRHMRQFPAIERRS